MLNNEYLSGTTLKIYAHSEPVQSTTTVGVYYKQWTPTRIGTYKYSWKASGTINSTSKSFFEVKDYKW